MEQPGQSISSAPVETSVGAEGASSGAEGARAAISNAPAEPRWLDVANVGRCGVFAARPSQLIELLSAWNVDAVNIYSVEVCVHVSVAVLLKFFIAPVSLALPYRFCFG